jgi:hypothetical protein
LSHGEQKIKPANTQLGASQFLAHAAQLPSCLVGISHFLENIWWEFVRRDVEHGTRDQPSPGYGPAGARAPQRLISVPINDTKITVFSTEQLGNLRYEIFAKK